MADWGSEHKDGCRFRGQRGLGPELGPNFQVGSSMAWQDIEPPLLLL
jgi:hypothetical protein